jgi:hypothetical protein
VADDLVALLEAYTARFNAAVRSGDYAGLVGSFAPDAELVFVGVPVGPFAGRDAIARAYAAQPPDDEVRLLGSPRVEGDTVESDYAWAADGGRAGRMILTARGDAVSRLTVTFE